MIYSSMRSNELASFPELTPEILEMISGAPSLETTNQIGLSVEDFLTDSIYPNPYSTNQSKSFENAVSVLKPLLEWDISTPVEQILGLEVQYSDSLFYSLSLTLVEPKSLLIWYERIEKLNPALLMNISQQELFEKYSHLQAKIIPLIFLAHENWLPPKLAEDFKNINLQELDAFFNGLLVKSARTIIANGLVNPYISEKNSSITIYKLKLYKHFIENILSRISSFISSESGNDANANFFQPAVQRAQYRLGLIQRVWEKRFYQMSVPLRTELGDISDVQTMFEKILNA